MTGSEFWASGLNASYAYKYGQIVIFNLQSRAADSKYIPAQVFTEIGRISVKPRYTVEVFSTVSNNGSSVVFYIAIGQSSGAIQAYNYSSVQCQLPYTNIVYLI